MDSAQVRYGFVWLGAIGVLLAAICPAVIQFIDTTSEAKKQSEAKRLTKPELSEGVSAA